MRQQGHELEQAIDVKDIQMRYLDFLCCFETWHYFKVKLKLKIDQGQLLTLNEFK